MDPRVVAALAALEQANGRLMPADVVRAARNARSPLHGYFEWQDATAAERYRLTQAAQLIRRIKIEVTIQHLPFAVPKYLRDPSFDTGAEAGPRGYRTFEAVRTEEENARAAVVDEMRRVTQAIRRAKTLAAAFGFEEDLERIDDLVRSIVCRALPSPDDQPGGTA